MIRKPTDADFREGDAVKVLRETGKITLEGSKGIGKGLHRLLLMYLGGIMAFGLAITLIVGTSGLALIPIAVGGYWFWQSRKQKDAARIAALREESARLVRGAPTRQTTPAADGAGDDVAYPAEVRRQGNVEADIGAVAQQVAILFAIGLVVLLLAGGLGGIGIVFGMMFVMLAVIIGSRVFGDRKLIEWDTRKVKVWHLLSEGEMQWSDVTDVTVEKAGRTNLAVYFQSGSRRNIVITALHNRLGGPTTLRVPIRYMNLPQAELEKLLRDLFCWRAAGNSIAPGAAAQRQAPGVPSAPTITPLTDPRDSFDPDAIMANYLRQRQQTFEAVGREDIAPVPSPADQRPVFGRKRA